LDAAVAFAEAADWEPVADLARDVYTDEPSPHAVGSANERE
jgi:hypothetical protein